MRARTITESPIHRGWRWLRDHPRVALAIAVILCLGPFVAKPVHLDDPVYLWTARQIQAHPLDPYGFDANWSTTVRPVSDITKNPPLVSYYIAAVAAVFGWSEVALHAAFLLFPLAAALGTYELARRMCAQPLLAALATLLTPVFLVSSTTLMCDLMMLACWIWAVVLWDRGLEEDRPWLLAGAATLAGAAALTKYFGVCVMPLMVLHALLRQRKIGRWVIYLLIPVALLAAYQWGTSRLYGQGLFFSAGEYALSGGGEGRLPFAARLVGVLEFTGGCLAWALFVTPLLWRRSLWTVAAVLSGLAAVFFHFAMGYDREDPFTASSAGWVGAQVALWTLAGLTVVGLAAWDVRRKGTPEAWLLLCWVGGTLIFAGFLNWTLSGRSILPLAPAVAILLVRRWEGLGRQGDPKWRVWLLLPGALLALAAARADHLWAQAHRAAAAAIQERVATAPGTLWFTGHWGFQYYMEAGRGRAFDEFRSAPQAGDLLVVPLNNASVDVPQEALARSVTRLRVAGPAGMATMRREAGAGFYSSVWAPLPFGFGRIPAEEFLLFQFPQSLPPGGRP